MELELENPPSVEGLASKANTFPLLSRYVLCKFCIICREIVSVWDLNTVEGSKTLTVKPKEYVKET